jgi:hypothetical protein
MFVYNKKGEVIDITVKLGELMSGKVIGFGISQAEWYL